MQQETRNTKGSEWPNCEDWESTECGSRDRLSICSFTHSGLRKYCRRGGKKIVRAKVVMQDGVEIEFYKLLGPCACEPIALVSALTRPM